MPASSSTTSDPFAFGLARSLDGVEAYLARRGGRRARRSRRAWATLDDADIAGDKRFREARKAVREAEKALRDARKLERRPRATRASDARAAAERRLPRTHRSHGFTAVTPVYTCRTDALECAQHRARWEGGING